MNENLQKEQLNISNPHDNIKVDKLRFQYNKLSQLLVILGLVFVTVGMFLLITFDNYSDDNPIKVIPDFYIALDIVFGIINLLVLFLASEKVKYYDKNWSLFGVFIMAALNLVRIFLTPLYAFNKEWLTRGRLTLIIILLALGVVSLVFAGVIATRKYLLLSKHQKELKLWEKSN